MSTQLFEVPATMPAIAVTRQSQWAREDQPVYKLVKSGKDACTNTEILSLLIDGANPMATARQLLARYGNDLDRIAKLGIHELERCDGIGKASAARIVACFEIARRRPVPAYQDKVSTSRDAYAIIRSKIEDEPYEQFWVILLNQANKVLSMERVGEGGVSGVVVDPKKIFKVALDRHACSIVLAHNHPSGCVTPSEQDRKITKKMMDAGAMLEIVILDHLIIGQDQFFSFADEGQL